MIELKRVQPKDRQLFWNVNQKYLYEMTNYYNDTMDADGNYQYGYFDTYFTDPERIAYFVYYNNNLAGFAMINPYSYLDKTTDYVMAEFTIFPIYHKKHIATIVIDTIFQKYIGFWEIKYNDNNLPAKTLWNKVCAKYNQTKTHLTEFETVLSFSTKDSAKVV